MRLFCDNCEDGLDLYVIHTAAPVSTKTFDMRNNQIAKLKSDFTREQNI